MKNETVKELIELSKELTKLNFKLHQIEAKSDVTYKEDKTMRMKVQKYLEIAQSNLKDLINIKIKENQLEEKLL